MKRKRNPVNTGKVSARDLSNGYIQAYESYDGRETIGTVLWREHEVYHIRTHAHNGRGRLKWDTSRTYTNAQKIFRTHIKTFHY